MEVERLKALLRLASCRIKVLRERLEAQAKLVRTQIITLSEQPQSQAECMIRIQTLIRDDYLQEAYALLDTHLQLLMMNLGMLSQKTLMTTTAVGQAAMSIAGAADALRQVPELKAIAKLLSVKKSIDMTMVDPELQKRLDAREPPELLCQQYLEVLCQKPPVKSAAATHAADLEQRFNNLRAM